MAVCIEPKEYVIGLKPFEHWVYRDAEERCKRLGLPTKPAPRSEPGDLDLVVYSLRKWCRLALGGNPTAQLLLYSPVVVSSTFWGDFLRLHKHLFVSRRAIKAYLGYMNEQKHRLMGERGQKAVNRPELVAAYGFDTKYAYHMLRLGYQGLEYAETHGNLTLPIPEATRKYLLDVRHGKYTLAQVCEDATRLEAELETILKQNRLPDSPRESEVNALLISAYSGYWA
jgi:predicted nucleotidyltransferase